MPRTPPNLILILIDDLGCRDLSCLGSSFYRTPHLDRMAQEGIVFTAAYASCPVCSPTRASLLTGKYPAAVGITDWIDWGGQLHPCRGRLIDAPYLKELPRSEYTLARALRDAGYTTWHVGKWHLGSSGSLPQDHGFDQNIGGGKDGAPHTYFAPWPNEPLADLQVPPGTYLTDYLTARAIELIRKRPRHKPFFLNLWHYAVHTPIQAKPDAIRRWSRRAARLGLDQINPFEIGEHFPAMHQRHLRVKRRRIQSDPIYAAMIANMDWNIGRLLDTLREEGIEHDTLVAFTSDNGGLATAEGSPTCNAPYKEGKGWMAEGGVRVPLILWWPGRIPPGLRSSEPVSSPDLYPTFLEAADLDARPSQHRDGLSLLPLWSGSSHLPREALFWHYPHYGNQGGTPGSSVRSGDYKLIEFFEDGCLELYNLRNDPSENHNLARRKPETTARLHELLQNWRKSVEARLPAPNLGWNPRVGLRKPKPLPPRR